MITQYTDGFGGTGQMTTGSIVPLGDWWLPNTAPNTGNYYITTTPIPEPPRECSGDVHVFPCPHCDTCKCGDAVKAKPKAKAKR